MLYIYFSETSEVREKQVQQRSSFVEQSTIYSISNPEAVMILVAIIQHNGISTVDILALPEIKKRKMSTAKIQGFMEFHGLLKKNPDSER